MVKAIKGQLYQGQRLKKVKPYTPRMCSLRNEIRKLFLHKSCKEVTLVVGRILRAPFSQCPMVAPSVGGGAVTISDGVGVSVGELQHMRTVSTVLFMQVATLWVSEKLCGGEWRLVVVV